MAKMFRIYSVIQRPKAEDYWLNIGAAFPHRKGNGFTLLIDGKRYAHIIDPRTGYPVPGVQSVTVLVSRQRGAGALSDAASKPIFIGGPGGWKEAAASMGVSCAMLVDADGVVHVTRELSARIRFSGPARIAVQESP